jgi:hypothetical protein
MLREMEEAKRKAAEAARRKLAAEKRARDDAETAARLRDEAAEAQRLAEAAAAAREAELKKLKEDEANSFWLQEAMRLEEEAARKRKKKAKAAVSKKDTIVPKDLQVQRPSSCVYEFRACVSVCVRARVCVCAYHFARRLAVEGC